MAPENKCPNCKFVESDCRCGYDPNLTCTTTDDTGPPDWTIAKATEWDGPVVLSSAQFVEPKPHKCPVCEGSGKNLCELTQDVEIHDGNFHKTCHGCKGEGWVVA